MADDTSVELRGPCPREIVDVLDAICMAKRITRTELVNRILKAWAVDRVHESMLVERLTRGNPPLKESGWGPLE
jgi:hypothetical protein